LQYQKRNGGFHYEGILGMGRRGGAKVSFQALTMPPYQSQARWRAILPSPLKTEKARKGPLSGFPGIDTKTALQIGRLFLY